MRFRLLSTMCFFCFLSRAAATTPDPCKDITTETTLNSPDLKVVDGDAEIKGSAVLSSGNLRVCVNGQPAKFEQNNKDVDKVTFTKGTYDATLKNPLSQGQFVRLEVTSDDDTKKLITETTVAGGCLAGSARLTKSPKEGQDTIYGVGAASTGDVHCLIAIYVNTDQADLIDSQGQSALSIETGSDGAFAARLKNSLDAGQCVVAMQYEKGKTPTSVASKDISCSQVLLNKKAGKDTMTKAKKAEDTGETDSAATACNSTRGTGYIATCGALVEPALDFGRARGYFAGGAVVSADGGNFSTQNVFLSFNFDKNWVWGGPVGRVHTASERAKGIKSDYQRLMFNTFFEARLTAVPANVVDCNAVQNKNQNFCKTPAQPAATPAATASPTPTPTTQSTLDTFITSRKSGVLIGGAYMPIVLTTWTHAHDPYSFTLGPIMKVGFATPVDAVDRSGATIKELSPKSFYTFYGYGARLGLSKMSHSRNVAPELVSYFDILSGRFSNFDSPDPNSTLRYSRPWRFAFEGLLKVPTLPLVLGVSANVHQNFGLGNSRTVDNAKDDLRFFFGTKFDAGKLIGKLKNLNE